MSGRNTGGIDARRASSRPGPGRVLKRHRAGAGPAGGRIRVVTVLGATAAGADGVGAPGAVGAGAVGAGAVGAGAVGAGAADTGGAGGADAPPWSRAASSARTAAMRRA